MMQMKKIDIAAIRQAAEGETAGRR